MSDLTNAQDALAAANTVLADVNLLNTKMVQIQTMLQSSQASAAPITPAIMAAKQQMLVSGAALLVDITAAVAAAQATVTGLGG